MIVLQPTYFSPVIQYVSIANCSKILFEVEDNFQKQTYRNRCYINTANGKHLLNVPIQHNKGVKQKTKDIKIDYKDSWNIQHLKTLETSYNSSPFFEFYIDDLESILKKPIIYLLDLNLKCHDFIMDALQIEIPTSQTNEYCKETNFSDSRYLVSSKKEKRYELDRYIQVFEEKNGFISNLSILDLLFMEGPNTLNYLESQKIQL